jgi:hypothetical protein
MARVTKTMNEFYQGCTSLEEIAKRTQERMIDVPPSRAIDKVVFREACAQFDMTPEKFMQIQESLSVAYDAQTERGQQARMSTFESLREISSDDDPTVLEAREAFFKFHIKKRSDVQGYSKALDVSLFRYKCHNCDIQSKDLPEGQKLLRCGSCGEVFYCSKSCQVQHWKSGHKRDCKKQSVSK